MADARQDIEDVVDEFVDDIDSGRFRREADRLGITTEDLLRRVVNELRVRLDD